MTCRCDVGSKVMAIGQPGRSNFENKNIGKDQWDPI